MSRSLLARCSLGVLRLQQSEDDASEKLCGIAGDVRTMRQRGLRTRRGDSGFDRVATHQRQERCNAGSPAEFIRFRRSLLRRRSSVEMLQRLLGRLIDVVGIAIPHP